MDYKELELSSIYLDQENFELECTHPRFKTLLFQGEFEYLNVRAAHFAGSYLDAPEDDIDIDFKIYPDSFEVFDNEGEEVKELNKDVVALIEQFITEYIFDNVDKFSN
jgi:hypothetical protein